MRSASDKGLWQPWPSGEGLLIPEQPQQWAKRLMALSFLGIARGCGGLSARCLIVKVFLAEWWQQAKALFEEHRPA